MRTTAKFSVVEFFGCVENHLLISITMFDRRKEANLMLSKKMIQTCIQSDNEINSP